MKWPAKFLLFTFLVVATIIVLNCYWASDGYKAGKVLEWGQLPALPKSARILHANIKEISMLFFYDKWGELRFRAPMDDVRQWIQKNEFAIPDVDFERIRKETGVMKYALVGNSSKMEVDEKTGTVNIQVRLLQGPD